MEETPANTVPQTKPRRVWPLLKWVLFVGVMVFVSRRALQLWRDSPQTELHVSVVWLIPAAVMYLVGWLPSVWFWQALLKRMHQPVGRYAATRAHYVGQVGKYMPGKALVLVLRGSLLKEAGANPVFAGVTAAYETLVFMWAGTALALALAPLTMPATFWQQMPNSVQSLRQPVWLLPLVVLVGTVAFTPFSAWLFTLVGRKSLPRDPSSPQPPAFTAGLMVQGAFITSLGWLCHALSLGCTLQSVSDRPFDLTQFPVWLASICVSTVGGFVILVAPGGIGVREWLLVEMLKDQPAIGPTHAVVAAGLLRAVWFVAELVAAGVLYVVRPASPTDSKAPSPYLSPQSRGEGTRVGLNGPAGTLTLSGMKLSLVIPVLNEVGSLRDLHAQIAKVAAEQSLDIEIIFVDDGSSDGSWNLVEQLARDDSRVSGIRFRRNFGKAAALTAGFHAARGDLIMTMDADLQDDPAEIPNFLAKLNEGNGADFVNGWKMRRLDPWHKTYPSKVFNWLVSRLTGLKLHDHNCGVKLFRVEVAHEIRLYGEMHRFVPVLAHAKGFRVVELGVNHRPRQHGHSKYGFRRFARGFLDLLTVTFLTDYGQRPHHMLGWVGLVCLGFGFAGLGYLAVIWLLMNVFSVWPPTPIGNRPLLAYSIASTLLGAQAIAVGLIAELIVHYNHRDSDSYSVAEETPSSNR